jgi:hypothetical protein
MELISERKWIVTPEQLAHRQRIEKYLREGKTVSGGLPLNLPAQWGVQKLYSQSYPILGANATAATKNVIVELTKYLQGVYLSRMFVRLSGNIVIAGAGAGTATGKDNPEALLVSANISTQPQYQNVVPFNSVSSRALLYDSFLNRGFIDKQSTVADSAGTTAIDVTYEFNFKRSDWVLGGIDYTLPLNRYKSALMNLTFGGRDQVFTGGTNTWDVSGLTIDVYADYELNANPQFLHAHELFENTYNITASNPNFKIDTLPPGFEYSDLFFLGEEANVLNSGIINNISIASGSQFWTQKGETNAKELQKLFLFSNNRILSDKSQSLTGLYAFPLRDGMFTRGLDARYAPLVVTLDVTSLSVNSVVRLIGRRMIPGGIYTRKAQPKSKMQA